MSKPAKSGQSVHATSVIVYGKSLTVPNTIMTTGEAVTRPKLSGMMC